MSSVINVSLAIKEAKKHIAHRESETVRIHCVGIKYYKQSHEPKAIMITYDLWRRCGRGRRLIGQNKVKQIKLKDVEKRVRKELFFSPMLIMGLKEFST